MKELEEGKLKRGENRKGKEKMNQQSGDIRFYPGFPEPSFSFHVIMAR